MNDRDRATAIARIKLKALRARLAVDRRHDPEPGTPDVAQTVGVSELSLLVTPVRRPW